MDRVDWRHWKRRRRWRDECRPALHEIVRFKKRTIWRPASYCGTKRVALRPGCMTYLWTLNAVGSIDCDYRLLDWMRLNDRCLRVFAIISGLFYDWVLDLNSSIHSHVCSTAISHNRLLNCPACILSHHLYTVTQKYNIFDCWLWLWWLLTDFQNYFTGDFYKKFCIPNINIFTCS